MKNIFLSLFILNVIQFLSCQKVKEEIYPNEPSLKFKNIEITNTDTLGFAVQIITLTLNYTDGDSNFGKNYLFDTNYNCITTLYKKTEGIFNLVSGTTNPIYYIIPEIKIQNHTFKQGPITIKTRSLFDGELQIQIFNTASFPFIKNDTLKATVQIIDNENNKSNIAEIEKIFTN